MSETERIATTRTIAASPATIFDLLRRPDGHVRIDGSGMLIAAPDATPVTAVGDTFEIHMDRRPLGDNPDMAEYVVTVIIVGFEEGRTLEWSLLKGDGEVRGYFYGYRIEKIGDGESLVTSYCDWGGMSDAEKIRWRWPIVPLHMLEKSLDNLQRIVTG